MSPDERRGHLVVVGASAGGIEALSVFVASLGKDFPAAVVLAQHLDPTRPSLLAEILERKTELPVVQVDGDTALEPGKVYVVPSNRHVVIRDGNVTLESDHGDRPRPSIDLLLSSAAKSYGERLIAVILTGSGSDGAAGAVQVKDAGGVVVIQNPRTAAHPSMPLALPPTAVDHVVDLADVGRLLTDILTGVPLPESLDRAHEDVLADVLARVTRHAAIDFRQYKPTTILRRLSRRMAVKHARSLDEYRSLLETDPDELEDLTKSLLIKVTGFFRDPEAFTYLEREILPGIIDNARQRGRQLRLWSAGCATGEEAYSLALLVTNLLGSEIVEWNVKVFATDVDEDAIAFARRGLYPRNVLDEIQEPYRNHYVEPVDYGLRVSKSIRQMVIFGQQDLSRGVPFPRIDLVVCRNLLIYFKPELQEEVLDLFAYSLHQTRGYLFLGKAETARPSKAVFEMVNKKWKVYRCVNGALPIMVKPFAASTPVAAPGASDAKTSHPGLPTELRGGETDFIRRTNEFLLRQLPIGIVVIDRTYRILSLNASARRLLGIRDNAIDQDFLHSARGLPYQDVRSAIDRAFRERSTISLGEMPLGTGGYGEGAFVALSVVPLQQESGNLDFALVTILDATENVGVRRRLKEVEQQQKAISEELNSANRRLTDMNKELQDANEELQAANEEMMLAQEELQATNEEFEATNEELQATNEELETNNEELQATNEELETTNEELQARTGELQDLTRVMSAERTRLTEMLALAPFSSMVVHGGNLELQSASESLSLLFNRPLADSIGRPISEVCTDPRLAPLREGVVQTFTTGGSWSSGRMELGPPGATRWFLFTAVAGRNEHQQVDMVVIYAEDITSRRLLEETVRADRLKVMLDQVGQVAMALFDATTGRLVHGTARYFTMVERLLRTPAPAAGQKWSDLWFGSSAELESFERVRETGKALRLPQLTVDEVAGTSIWDCSLIPIFGEDDPKQVVQIVLSAIEVTEAVRRREDLERLDQMKDEFLSLASHELRTPLAPLSAYSDLLVHLLERKERSPEWETQMRDIVSRFRKQVRHMGRLTDDLLDVSRLQSGKFRLQLQPVSIRAIIEDAILQSPEDPRAPAIVPNYENDGNLWVNADELRAAQVVRNFLMNARRHAPDSGPIEVGVRSVSRDGHDWVRVEVCDHGPGVPKEVRDRLFTRYFQTGTTKGAAATRGLGLGLYISRQIVEQHGGRIGASFDSGSTFWFELPRVAR